MSVAHLEISIAIAIILSCALASLVMISREKILSIYALDRMLKRMWGMLVLSAAAAFTILFVFTFHIPTMPLFPVSAGWRFKGFSCTIEALVQPTLSSKCPFLTLKDVATANYESSILWTAHSILTVQVAAIVCCAIIVISFASIVALSLARAKKILRWRNLQKLGSPDNLYLKNTPLSIFVSYRRKDTGRECELLYAELNSRAKVFVDVVSMAAGIDFPSELVNAIRQSDAVLVLIGPKWLEKLQESEARQNSGQTDYVKMEIILALRIDIPLVPILIGTTVMPAELDLPKEIKPLAKKSAIHVSSGDLFAEDVPRIFDFISRSQIAV